jgi:F-type H+-transporting ATPase subunit c
MLYGLLAQAQDWAGLAMLGAGIGCGLSVIGGGLGIGRIGGDAMSAIARQPDASGRIGTNMIIAAALIEGFTFFSLVICLLIWVKIK